MMDDEKAKAIATAYQDATADQELLTRTGLEIALQKELAPIRMEQQAIKMELQVLKYMVGIVLGGIVALILKAFF